MVVRCLRCTLPTLNYGFYDKFSQHCVSVLIRALNCSLSSPNHIFGANEFESLRYSSSYISNRMAVNRTARLDLARDFSLSVASPRISYGENERAHLDGFALYAVMNS